MWPDTDVVVRISYLIRHCIEGKMSKRFNHQDNFDVSYYCIICDDDVSLKYEEMKELVLELVREWCTNDLGEEDFFKYYHAQYLDINKWHSNWHLGYLKDTTIFMDQNILENCHRSKYKAFIPKKDRNK